MKRSSKKQRKSHLDKVADQLVKQHELNEKLGEKLLSKDIFTILSDEEE
jgi:hypothetical protein